MPSKKRTPGVYQIVNTITNTKYVRSSCNIHRRVNRHFASLKKSVHKNPRIQAVYNAHGRGSFEWSILEIVEDREARLDTEQRYIDSGEFQFNISRNARSGHTLSDEERASREQARRNKPKKPPLSGTDHPRYGKKLSDEHRKRISEANKGKKKHSDEARKRISEGNRGKKRSDDHRKRISEANKGKTVSDGTRAKISATKRAKYPAKAKISTRRNSLPGTYITPYGTFTSPEDAATACEKLISQSFLWRICKNPTTVVTRGSFTKSPYLKTVGPSCIGKTYRELGFWFEPKP